jgi:hypothetical protein
MVARRRHRGRSCRQDSVAAVGLLIDADVVRQAAEEVEFGFDPAQDLVRRRENLEVAEADYARE